MEEKVKHTLGLIEEDADSFRKKAEMYYQRRPELIEFVQEAYKSYRALAERYDHLSGELHKANNTIASVYPDQVHFGTDDVEEDSSGVPSQPRKTKMVKPPIPNQQMSDMGKATSGAMTRHRKKTSQMNVVEAEEEIDMLQKEILSLQTEKVFVKSSYERGMANYMEIERKITETQERVCNLQDEFSAMSIDDDEARAVMVATALKSCEDTLVTLNEQQHKCNGDAEVEFKRIKSVKDRIKQLGFESLSKSNTNTKKSDPVADSNPTTSSSKNTTTETDNPSTKDSSIGGDLGGKIEKRIQVNDYCEKIRGTLEQQSEMCVVDLAETIDGLVNKVINLEATVSSYESQIERLRLETDEAHKKLDVVNTSSVEDDDKDKKSVMKKTVDELAIIDELERSIRNQGRKLHIEFRNTYKFFFDLSRQLDNEDIDFPFEMEVMEEEQEQEEQEQEHEIHNQEQVEGVHIKEEEKEVEEKEQLKSQKDDKETQVETNVELKKEPEEDVNLISMESISLGRKALGRSHAAKDLDVSFKGKQGEDGEEGEGDEVTEEDTPSNWQHLFLDGLEDREKILLAEYTSVLRNYRETRKKLTEAEKKNQEHLFKSVSQMKQLRNAFLKKDEEIQSLKNRLSLMEAAGMDEPLPKSEETSNINKEAADSDINRAKLPSRTVSCIPLEINMEILDMVGKDLVDQINAQSRVPTVEERFRKDIDNLLDENLEFWLRFSSSFQQIQKYQLEVEQLHCKILGLKQHNVTTATAAAVSSADHHNSSHSPATITKRTEGSMIYKHLKDLESDLSVWIEQNALLKEELQGRCTSLEGIATEIERVSEKGMEGDELKFTDFHASKFRGEVINMQQENSKVANELQSGLDHVRLLQTELEKALANLNAIEPSSKLNHSNLHYRQPVRMVSIAGEKPKIPLRSFLFGVKPKPKKTSIFSCMNQAFLQKQYSDLRPGLPR